MQYTTIALAALAAGVSAQETGPNVISILQVLQTVVPSSILQEAQTNSAAVVSSIASDFAAGMTPTWYSALPSDIQSYLNPTGTQEANSIASELSQSVASITTMPAMQTGGSSVYAVGNATSVSSAQQSILSSIGAANSSIISAINSSAMTNTMSNTIIGGISSTTGGAGGASQTTGGSSGSGSDSSSSSTDSGAMPTAVYGMGIAGAVGLVGLFAL